MDRISLNKICQVIQGESGSPDLMMSDVERISIDSRTTEAGDLFFAIQGKRLDGHQFVTGALARGAQASVVNRGTRTDSLLQPYIYVEDVNQAFQDLAYWYRRQQKLTVIGVTGSVGKTTTRNMIHTVLSTILKGIQSPANYNNEFGVPLSIAQIELGHQFAVLELGASAPGEIRELARLAQPEIGVITGIGPSHLEHFGSLDRTADAKGELFEELPETGLAILNGDDSFASQLISKTATRILKVGLSEQNDLQAIAIQQTLDGSSFQVDGTEFLLPLQGKHFIYSALFAIAIAKEFGFSNQDLVEGFRQIVTVPGRCHVEQIGSWTVIDDSYNSSPVSMAAACHTLQECPCAGKRIIVMGDMLELGADSKKYHQEIGELIAALKIDSLFVCGKQAGAVVQGALTGDLSPDR
ncbi:UDP-N-acetylmuramoyl-tripeptide--D-alanyl-D-alanine ligase, partial [uncultured Gimesia sp.]|uniref:UDP-N-acetylmuramoyl-tripeptide--D-alanyl-D- alanine ligase n=1 Tax=uncultured Gimesia sp. TaxID=1678688 RepID=UPI00261C8B6B